MRTRSLISHCFPLFLGLFVMCSATQTSGQLIVAHRGASHDAPENTLAAFNLAWQKNADGIECDIRLSKDGQLVCIHDKDTERVAGKKLIVAESTLAELRQLDVGRWKAPKWAKQKIPTLEEVLATAPSNKKVFVELKAGPEIAKPVCTELDRLKFDLSRIVIISFNEQTIAAVKRNQPKVQAHWLTSFEQNDKSQKWSPSADKVISVLKKNKGDGLGLNANSDVVTPDFLKRLRQAEIVDFHVWTVNDPEVAHYFKQRGAMGITTDRPAFIRNALQDKP